MKKIISIIAMIFIFLFLIGCTKTLTQAPTVGDDNVIRWQITNMDNSITYYEFKEAFYGNGTLYIKKDGVTKMKDTKYELVSKSNTSISFKVDNITYTYSINKK